MNFTGSYSNDAMLRQISERVRIDLVPEGIRSTRRLVDEL